MSERSLAMSHQEERTAFEDFEFRALPVEELDQMLSPYFPPMSPNVRDEDPSIFEEEVKARGWQKRFLEAAMIPVQGVDDFNGKWQRELNGKAATQSRYEYSNRNVNLRLAVLFHIALNFHVGGPRYYPVGPNNQDDSKAAPELPFLERLLDIEHALRVNKKNVMDVIEGIRVVPFAQAPRKYNLLRLDEGALETYMYKTGKLPEWPGRAQGESMEWYTGRTWT